MSPAVLEAAAQGVDGLDRITKVSSDRTVLRLDHGLDLMMLKLCEIHLISDTPYVGSVRPRSLSALRLRAVSAEAGAALR